MEPTSIATKHPAEGRFTWDDFVALGDDDSRELIDGELIEVGLPTQVHEFIVNLVSWFITTWVRQHKAGAVLASGYKLQISRKRGVMPDIQFYRTGSLPRDARQGLTGGRPDLAVEVISPSSRTIDSVVKLNWYAQLGVPEYWLIDPEARSLVRYLLRDGHYFIDAHANDDIVRPDTFPGMEIPLAELWVEPGGEGRT